MCELLWYSTNMMFRRLDNTEEKGFSCYNGARWVASFTMNHLVGEIRMVICSWPMSRREASADEYSFPETETQMANVALLPWR